MIIVYAERWVGDPSADAPDATLLPRGRCRRTHGGSHGNKTQSQLQAYDLDAIQTEDESALICTNIQLHRLESGTRFTHLVQQMRPDHLRFEDRNE